MQGRTARHERPPRQAAILLSDLQWPPCEDTCRCCSAWRLPACPPRSTPFGSHCVRSTAWSSPWRRRRPTSASRCSKEGGNAVDAAVAVGFAMAVTHPFAGNLGGGGYMLIRMADGRATFIDFRERAPEKASRNMYLDAKGALTKDSIEGWRSSGVPGTVRGFEIARQQVRHDEVGREHGARGGARLEGLPRLLLAGGRAQGVAQPARAPRSPSASSRRNGSFYDVGETLVQPELAQTLERISKNGAERVLRRRDREAIRRGDGEERRH